MKRKWILGAAGLCLTLAFNSARAGDGAAAAPSYPAAPAPWCPSPQPGVMPGFPGMSGVPGMPGAPSGTAPGTTPGTTPSGMEGQAPPTGGEAPGSFNPQMIGDFQGYRTSHLALVNGQTVRVVDPVATRAAFKIVDNVTPIPMDRVFLVYNYYSAAEGVESDRHDDISRFIFGAEYAFMDNNYSVAVRVPLVTQSGDARLENTSLGDISVILKGIIVRDCDSGSALVGGLVTTLPTAPRIDTGFGADQVRSVLFQPFIGGILQADDLYVQAFSSAILPTHRQEPTLLFNDVGVGYYVWRCREGMLNFIVPTLEMHLTTPIDHRGATDPVQSPDVLALTGGAHFGFGERTLLTIAGTTPLTGPKPYDYELIAQLNFRY